MFIILHFLRELKLKLPNLCVFPLQDSLAVTLHRMIGHGSTGGVHEATTRTTGNDYAVKVMSVKETVSFRTSNANYPFCAASLTPNPHPQIP
jgi:hypothetical protein